MMIKLETKSIPVPYPNVSEAAQKPVRRLIVLVPADSDYNVVAHRVWELASTLESPILFLSLCGEEVQVSSLRRQLITMSAMVQDGRVRAEARVESGWNWVNAVRSDLQDGDMIVCFAEQRTGLLRRPLSQVLQANLRVPIYILSGFTSEQTSQPHQLSQLFAWIGSLGIIVGSFVLQIRVLSLSELWIQTPLLILSMLGEIGLIWGWNTFFS